MRDWGGSREQWSIYRKVVLAMTTSSRVLRKFCLESELFMICRSSPELASPSCLSWSWFGVTKAPSLGKLFRSSRHGRGAGSHLSMAAHAGFEEAEKSIRLEAKCREQSAALCGAGSRQTTEDLTNCRRAAAPRLFRSEGNGSCAHGCVAA